MYVIKDVIYRAKELYDSEKPEYDCYIPCFTGDYQIVDCWICNEKGDIHPGYNVCGVPINVGYLGEIIGERY